MSVRTYAVIGLGNFGAAVATDLVQFGNNVIALDRSEAIVAQFVDEVDQAMIADGRDEDDVIMLGCLQARDDHLFQLGGIRGFVAAIRELPTNLGASSQTENIVFQDPETDEFHRITGVFDYREHFEVSAEEAARISPVLPIWAEFSIFEGGRRRLARASAP